jgi:hypothetical protein
MMNDVREPGQIKDLIDAESDPCISIYMPTHEKGTETKEDPIRFKNLLRTCERCLKEQGLARGRLARILQPAFDLLDASVAWRYLDRGLAVFISSEVFRAFTLSIDCPERVWVGEHFYIKPLVPLWSADKGYCVLALSQGQAKLYDADAWGIRERTLRDAPHSLSDFLKYDDAEEHLQYHTTSSGKSADSAAVFHGHGNVADKARRKKTVDEYVKAVRNAVERDLAGDHRPLALVAPEYVQSAYRDVSHYSHLLATGVTQSPDRLSETELHQAAQDVMRPSFEQEKRERLAHFHNLLAQGHALAELAEIVPATKQGRVDTLLLDPTVCLWDNGKDADSANAAGPCENREDLLDVAVRSTLSRGGNVYPVAREDLPSQSPAGAILRY